MAERYALLRMDQDGTLRFVRMALNCIEGMAASLGYHDTVLHPETGVPMNAVNLTQVTDLPAWDSAQQDDVVGKWH